MRRRTGSISKSIKIVLAIITGLLGIVLFSSQFNLSAAALSQTSRINAQISFKEAASKRPKECKKEEKPIWKDNKWSCCEYNWGVVFDGDFEILPVRIGIPDCPPPPAITSP